MRTSSLHKHVAPDRPVEVSIPLMRCMMSVSGGNLLTTTLAIVELTDSDGVGGKTYAIGAPGFGGKHRSGTFFIAYQFAYDDHGKVTPAPWYNGAVRTYNLTRVRVKTLRMAEHGTDYVLLDEGAS